MSVDYFVKLLSRLLKPFRTKGQHSLTNRDISEVVALNKLQIDKSSSASKHRLQDMQVNYSVSSSQKHEGSKLTNLPGVGPKVAKILLDAGYRTSEEVLAASNEELIKIKGIGGTVLKKIRKSNK